jgi:hypothetical protein
MFLNGEDNSESPNIPARAWAITVGVCMLPVYLIFSSFGMRGKGTVAACALGTLVLLVRMHRELMSRSWFWVVMALLVALHGLFVVYAPFPNRDFMYAVVAPMGFTDYYLCTLLIKQVESRMPQLPHRR